MRNNKVMALLTVAALAFGLAGCASSGPNAQASSGVSSTLARNAPSGWSRAAEERWFAQAAHGENP